MFTQISAKKKVCRMWPWRDRPREGRKYQHRETKRKREGQKCETLKVSGWKRQEGTQTNRKSMKGIEEKECVTKRKVMAVIGAIHHGTVLGVGVMCHPSIEPVAL